MSITISKILPDIPDGLKNPLINEYNSITQNFMEHKWTPSELSGGKFCEIVYTIIDGYPNNYKLAPDKPNNFVDACKRLENRNNVPRSFKILIPRLLPALYEIRNNRGVGHTGGDVDPNYMDAVAVLSIANWIMGELIRAYHDIDIKEAQTLVDLLTERRIPIVWQSGDMKRVLIPTLPIRDQILLLIASASSKVKFDDLYKWLDYKNKQYLKKILIKLHSYRIIEFNQQKNEMEILPPGTKIVGEKIKELKIVN
jgi:hypothetical protein